MTEHSLHQFGSYTTRTVARRRRMHAARRRMVGMRARMAELRSAEVMDDLAAAEEVHSSEPAD